ncbi:hypothetical protein E1267_16775 [Nonomuraea longispora]|uniref:Uncharacterized protein n=1 Tax=Nonomuraea longispora TaxID=1848320 RepID=A0A4R4NHH4_9ACTN|nr:hypothetical protein [Nonomuraea longispora]TDC06292.1 hypothetical protein E1267_16775 [Nonomuraea longispora]
MRGATMAGRAVSLVDGRTLEPAPAAFEAGAGRVLRDADTVLLFGWPVFGPFTVHFRANL